MKWLNLAAVVAGAGLLGACQTAHSDAREAATPEAEATPDLSERLAALEEQVAEARVAVEEAEARAVRAERRVAASSLPRAAAAPTPKPRREEPEPRASIDPVRLPAPTPGPPVPAATPQPTPRPRVVVARGTRLELDLETPLSSRTSQVGDSVVARVSSAVSPEGDVALPGGAYLEGRVTEVKASGRVSGRAHLMARFDTLVVRGQRHAIDTTDLVLEAENGHKRDAAVVGGGAAAGAIIGGIAGGKGGLGKGILIGGAAGTAAVLATAGKDVELPAGSRISLETLTTLRL